MGDEDRERRLRALRIERREQQEELEAIVAEADASTRTLADVLLDHGERGDRCRVEAGPHTIVGTVGHVADEVVTLVDQGGRRWDVALGSVSLVALVERGQAVRRIGGGHPRTLLARARELAARRAEVEVGRLDRPDPVRGHLVAVSREVLELERRGAPGPVVVTRPVVSWLSEVDG